MAACNWDNTILVSPVQLYLYNFVKLIYSAHDVKLHKQESFFPLNTKDVPDIDVTGTCPSYVISGFNFARSIHAANDLKEKQEFSFD